MKKMAVNGTRILQLEQHLGESFLGSWGKAFELNRAYAFLRSTCVHMLFRQLLIWQVPACTTTQKIQGGEEIKHKAHEKSEKAHEKSEKAHEKSEKAHEKSEKAHKKQSNAATGDSEEAFFKTGRKHFEKEEKKRHHPGEKKQKRHEKAWKVKTKRLQELHNKGAFQKVIPAKETLMQVPSITANFDPRPARHTSQGTPPAAQDYDFPPVTTLMQSSKIATIPVPTGRLDTSHSKYGVEAVQVAATAWTASASPAPPAPRGTKESFVGYSYNRDDIATSGRGRHHVCRHSQACCISVQPVLTTGSHDCAKSSHAHDVGYSDKVQVSFWAYRASNAWTADCPSPERRKGALLIGRTFGAEDKPLICEDKYATADTTLAGGWQQDIFAPAHQARDYALSMAKQDFLAKNPSYRDMPNSKYVFMCDSPYKSSQNARDTAYEDYGLAMGVAWVILIPLAVCYFDALTGRLGTEWAISEESPKETANAV